MTTANELFNQVKTVRAEMQSMLSKSGRIPNSGTVKRLQYEALESKERLLLNEWDKADRLERQELHGYKL